MKMTLKAKLIGGFLAVAVLVVVAGSVGITMTNFVAKAADQVINVMNPIQYAVTQAQDRLLRLNITKEKYQAARQGLGPIEDELHEHIGDFSMWLDMPLLGTDSAEFKQSDSGKMYVKDNMTLKVAQGSPEVVEILKRIKKEEDLVSSDMEELIKLQRTYAEYAAVTAKKTYDLEDFLPVVQIQHVNWIKALQDAIGMEVKFTGQTDHKECFMGKWLHAFQTNDKKLSDLLEKFKKEHEKLHETAIDVNAATGLEEKNKIFNRKKTVIVKIERLFSDLTDYANEIYADLNKRKSVLDKALAEESEHIEASVGELVGIINKELKTATDTAGKTKARANILLPIITVFAVVLAIVLGVALSGSIISGIKKVIAVSGKVAEGDLREKAAIDSQDEIGELARNINNMVDELNSIISEAEIFGRTDGGRDRGDLKLGAANI